MLADKRSDALIGNFLGQWLYLRNLKGTAPGSADLSRFRRQPAPGVSARNRNCSSAASCAKTRAWWISLNADYTFVNERLAQHYGIPNVYGNQFRRVNIPDPARRGSARAGQRADGFLLRQPHFAGAARQMDPDQYSGNAAAAAAAERSAAQRSRLRHHAPADGAASRQSRLRGVPQGDGPHRLLARKF